MFQRFIAFIKDTRIEMSKVTWPTRQSFLRDTIVVVAVSLGLAVFLGFLDYVFAYILNNFILK